MQGILYTVINIDIRTGSRLIELVYVTESGVLLGAGRLHAADTVAVELAAGDML